MILGLTGKSGTGKHTAAYYLQQKGWIIIDADTIAHSLYQPDTRVWQKLVEAFSENILRPDRTIDRQKVHQLVFEADEAQENLKKLNAIVHPPLRKALRERVEILRAQGKNGLVVAALWKELNLKKIVEKLIVIQADPVVAFKRIHERDGIDYEAFMRRWNSQTEPPVPDRVIDNHGSVFELTSQLLF